MSPERSLRHRPSAASWRSNLRLPLPSSPPSPRRGAPISTTPRKFPVLSEPIDILPKCSSEPLLPDTTGSPDGSPVLTSDGWFYRQMTSTDVFSPPSTLLSPESPQEVYEKDTKVVVTVTVEGSPGPVRTMVKLGTTVEETIKLVIEKYGNEGRTPKLHKTSASIYELHLSYFSLECLDRSDSIGNVGSRNFYLRKGKNSLETMFKAPDTAPTERPYLARTWMPMVFFPAYITRKTSKIARRMRKVWKVLGCLHCSS